VASLLALLALALSSAALAQSQPPPWHALEPVPVEGLAYDVDFFPGTSYDPSVPTVEQVLGFRAGDRAAFPEEIERVLEALDESSPRTRLVEYARTYEGRPLSYLIVSSPDNLARLDEIRSGLAKLADPRGLAAGEADELVASLPVTAWLAYSIHGDETSGSDGAMALAYHLTAATDAAVTGLLDEIVVLIDPMMNPDGRHRYLQQIAEHRSVAPNLDDQSLIHSGYWPWGRANHYLFDLNRDWILGVNPETRGRIRAAAEWHPLLFVDAHEMGALDTYLFGSGREPRNPNFPERRAHWQKVFARDQSEAFDRYNWKYYTGEWNEGWYPGYSDSWGELRGAVGLLYEQAAIAEDAVRRPEGTLTTYREATHHQAVSSLANLETLRRNARQLLREFLAEKRLAVSADGPWSGRTFAVLPTANRGRLDGFLDLMELQGFEVWVTPTALDGLAGVDQLGRRFSGRTLPPGTLLIPGRQPQAPLVSTMLEFDRPMPPEYLSRERDSLLRSGDSTIYDVTAWSLTMLHGLEAVTLDGDLPPGVDRWRRPAAGSAGSGPSGTSPPDAAVGWALDGVDDRAVVVAARLMERGVRVRAADEEFELGGARFSRGSLLVLPADNPGERIALAGRLDAAAAEVGLAFAPLSTGLGDGDLADIGGGHFTLLEPPRIALVGRSSISSVDFGSIWHLIDQTLAIRHSHLDGDSLAYADLRRYNVLVLPDRWGSLPESGRADLERWLEAGGTLIALSGSARDLASKDSGLTAVRRLPDVLGRLDEYETAVLREWMAESSELPAGDRIWAHTVGDEIDYPWSRLADRARPEVAELERRDAWQRQFMPQGAILAARTDEEHWLTSGSGPVLPVLYLAGNYGSADVLMAGDGVEAPIRFGALSADVSAAAPRRAGWGPVPAGQDLRLRMSGLLWPEAAARIANSAFVTRERRGNGQVILFATSPTFRGATGGTARVLLNAMVLGPGFGARHPIRP
jgi:hypothetical protein